MNRQRKTNRGLPRRVYLKNGAYRFFAAEPMRNPANGKLQRWIHLAYQVDGEVKMLSALAILLGSPKLVEGSMPQACAEFKATKLGSYGEDTRNAYSLYLDVISDEFEDFHASQVTTKDCATFLRNKFGAHPNTARKYTALMGKLFKFIIGELGLRQDNPIDQLDKSNYKSARREVLATHEQVQAIRAAGMWSKPRNGNQAARPTPTGPMFACIIDISYLLWARGIDIRMMRETQIENGRIRIKPSKTAKTSGKLVDITITPEIQEVIDRARAIKRTYGIISPFLFPTQKGGAYARASLISMWDNAKERIDMKDDITFRDIRALAATDAARRGEAHSDIQKRLVHTSSKTTDIYIKEAIPDISNIPMALPWTD